MRRHPEHCHVSRTLYSMIRFQTSNVLLALPRNVSATLPPFSSPRSVELYRTLQVQAGTKEGDADRELVGRLVMCRRSVTYKVLFIPRLFSYSPPPPFESLSSSCPPLMTSRDLLTEHRLDAPSSTFPSFCLLNFPFPATGSHTECLSVCS